MKFIYFHTPCFGYSLIAIILSLTNGSIVRIINYVINYFHTLEYLRVYVLQIEYKSTVTVND